MSEPEATPMSAPLRVEPFTGTDLEWDEAVRRFDGSTFCHLSGWRHVLAEGLGHELLRLAAKGPDGGLEGVLPLARVRSRLFGDFLLSMPFLSYGGPLGSEEAKLALTDGAIERAQSMGVDLLELRAREPLPGSMDVSSRKITVLKTLPESSEDLWTDGLRAKVRSQVRRPMKEGMTSRFGAELLSAFYDVFARTMRDLGTPVLPRAFFGAIVGALAEQVIVGVVEHEGETVAAGCGFEWGGEVEITWAGALGEYSRMAPNMLLYWAFMEESIRRGAHTFNFGRCTPGSGTHRFKMQWGAEEQPLPWAQWSPKGVVATPSPDSAKFRAATAIWRRLPLSIANLLGPAISRYLP